MNVSTQAALERLRQEQRPERTHAPGPPPPPTDLEEDPRLPTPPEDGEDTGEHEVWIWDMGGGR